MLAAAVLGIAGLTLAVPPMARAGFGPFWGGGAAIQSGACGGGPPAEAMAAGFTTCALYSNFTEQTGADWYPFPFPGNVTTLANWLDAFDNQSNIAWHWSNVGEGTQTAASTISVINDSACGGCQVMSDVLPSGSTAPNEQQSYMSPVEGIYGNATPSNVTTPIGVYWEITYRLNTITNDANIGVGEDDTPFLWNSAGVQNFSLNQETYSSDGYYDADSGYIPWNLVTNSPTPSVKCNGSTPPGFNCYPTVSNYSVANYYTYAYLSTTDGGLTSINNAYGCVFINHTLQSCNSPGSPAGNGYGTGYFNARLFNLLQVVAYPFPGPGPVNYNANGIYVQSIREFSCAGWATGQCNGTTLYNSAGLTYVH
jgi:hypothetical protein